MRRPVNTPPPVPEPRLVITSRFSPVKSLVTALVTAVLCIALLFVLDNYRPASVYPVRLKNSCPEAWPEMTYQQAFGRFYDDTSWRYGRDNGGQKYVCFTGYIREGKGSVKIELYYAVRDGGTFELYKGALNNVEQDLSEMRRYESEPFSAFAEGGK